MINLFLSNDFVVSYYNLSFLSVCLCVCLFGISFAIYGLIGTKPDRKVEGGYRKDSPIPKC